VTGGDLDHGQDIHEVTQGTESKYRSSHKNLFFSRSLLENIRYGKPEATREERSGAKKRIVMILFANSPKVTYRW
jgi:ABC-type multidrug transport system fused ATPase/permease subunit